MEVILMIIQDNTGSEHLIFSSGNGKYSHMKLVRFAYLQYYDYDRKQYIYKMFQIAPSSTHRAPILTQSNYSQNSSNLLHKPNKSHCCSQNLINNQNEDGKKLKSKNDLNPNNYLNSEMSTILVCKYSITNLRKSTSQGFTELERFHIQDQYNTERNKLNKSENVVNSYRQNETSGAITNFEFLLQSMGIDGNFISYQQKCYRLLNIIKNYSDSLHKQKQVSKTIQMKQTDLQKQVAHNQAKIKQFEDIVKQLYILLNKKTLEYEQLCNSMAEKQQQLQYNLQVLDQLTKQNKQWKENYDKVFQQLQELHGVEALRLQQIQLKNQQIQRLKQSIQYILLSSNGEDVKMNRQQILTLLQESNQQLLDLRNSTNSKLKKQDIIQIDGIIMPLQQAQKLKYVIEKQQESMQKYLYEKIKHELSQSLEQERSKIEVSDVLPTRNEEQIKAEEQVQDVQDTYQLKLEDELTRISKLNAKLLIQLSRMGTQNYRLRSQLRGENDHKLQIAQSHNKEFKVISEQAAAESEPLVQIGVLWREYKYNQDYQRLQLNVEQEHPRSTLFQYPARRTRKLLSILEAKAENILNQTQQSQRDQTNYDRLFSIEEQQQQCQPEQQCQQRPQQYQSIDSLSFYSVQSDQQRSQILQENQNIGQRADKNIDYQKYEHNQRVQTQESLPNYQISQQSQSEPEQVQITHKHKYKSKQTHRQKIFTYLCSELQKQLRKKHELHSEKQKYQRQYDQVFQENFISGVKLKQDLPQINEEDRRQMNLRC